MQEKQRKVKKSKGAVKTWVSVAVILILIPATIVLSPHLGDRNYYIAGVLIILFSMIPFFVGFESRRPQARELVTIAVMCAIAVVSRAAFIMLPQFKPLVGIVMITGIALGPAAGFLTGAISGFVSNFIFGQGPWTPWQMFAFGIAGFIAGLLAKKGLIKPEKRLPVAIIGFVTVMVIVGPILDTCTLFTMASMVDTSSAAMVYMAGVPFNAVHGVATFATLFVLCKPMMEKLERIKIKYGMMDEAEEPSAGGSSASVPGDSSEVSDASGDALNAPEKPDALKEDAQ